MPTTPGGPGQTNFSPGKRHVHKTVPYLHPDDRSSGRACLCRRSYPLWPSIFQKRKNCRPIIHCHKGSAKSKPSAEVSYIAIASEVLLPVSRANVVARQPIMLC